MMECINQKLLDEIFPPEKTSAFFDAIYGGAEDGAYDIRLTCVAVEPEQAFFRFELIRREGQCLRCNLTYGLPAVFERHPVIDAQGVASALAHLLGWKKFQWKFGAVEEINDDLHIIPLELKKEN